MNEKGRALGATTIVVVLCTCPDESVGGTVAQEGFEYDRFLRPDGDYPSLLVTVASPGAIVELVSAGLGVSILARWAVEPRLSSKELVALRLGEHGLQIPWHLVMRRSRTADSPAAKCAGILLDWVSREKPESATGIHAGGG